MIEIVLHLFPLKIAPIFLLLFCGFLLFSNKHSSMKLHFCQTLNLKQNSAKKNLDFTLLQIVLGIFVRVFKICQKNSISNIKVLFFLPYVLNIKNGHILFITILLGNCACNMYVSYPSPKFKNCF